MKTRLEPRRRGVSHGLVLVAVLALATAARGQTLHGVVVNASTWDNLAPLRSPPGAGTGQGNLVVGLWPGGAAVTNSPLTNGQAATTAALPFPLSASYTYALTPPGTGSYTVAAWVDGDADAQWDPGEPRGGAVAVTAGTNDVIGVDLTVADDSDGDGLADWWEAHWFGDLDEGRAGDPDHDGLTTGREYDAARGTAALAGLNPAHWDTDGDGLDDEWEYDRYAAGRGLNPTAADGTGDADGDGLSNLQEYRGLDGQPPLTAAGPPGVGQANAADGADALDPLNLDTDNDGLLDSFEAAWYDPAGGLQPRQAGSVGSDADHDGLSAYREQCLLPALREGGSNDIWSLGPEGLPGVDGDGLRALAPALDLGASGFATVNNALGALRTAGWTDPTDGTGYPEALAPGWDTDGDSLPDGWEVEFGLEPTDAAGDNGFLGNPDGDGLLNIEEYFGQDGERALAGAYLNGTGDETNPNAHDWRPDSTAAGPGIRRPTIATNYWDHHTNAPATGTLGGALPTRSLGADGGGDTDDDGIGDSAELQEVFGGGYVSASPVHAMHPFVRRAGLIATTNGIAIPDPEGSPARGYRPLLHARDWTVECYVKLRGAGCSGWLLNASGPGWLPDGANRAAFRLALSNDVPSVSFHTLGGTYYATVGQALPTNAWVHLAGVWDETRNSLALYIDGIAVQESTAVQSGLSFWLFASAAPPVIGRSPDGSFVDRVLVDEVRIWGVARSAAELEAARRRLVAPGTPGLRAYYRFDDGGATAEDYTRRAQNGLLGAAAAEYFFGDQGYALRTNGWAFVDDGAPVLGVHEAGADDADGDGLPDGWELVHHLDPLSAAGVDGAAGDPEGDGLRNRYEYWARTSPNAAANAGGVLDIHGDLDGDGLENQQEQQLASRPDLADTDDDGLSDGAERLMGTDPIDADSPHVPRALWLGGSASDYLTVPNALNQRLLNWTVEAWVNPTNATEGAGAVLRRTVERLTGGGAAVNYELGLEDAGGGLHPYAGFVTRDGVTNRVTGSAVPAGVWTHLAGTYEAATYELVLYVNGVESARRALLAQPPVNGKGGETFLRIGEDFGGRLDEVRLWDRARTAAQIASNYEFAVSSSGPGLVHSFRFDDGQATTNALPFGTFHQPFGAQDDLWPGDWSNQWVHAAMPHGASRFSADGEGVPLGTPSLTVWLEPPDAVSAGARWRVDAGVWRASGQPVTGLTAVAHALSFAPAPGWTAPTNETVTLSNRVATVLTRTYRANGALSVVIQPPAAAAAGAQWRVDGGAPWYASGAVATNLSPTAHALEYGPVPGWYAPTNETVLVPEGGTQTVTATYGAVQGQVTVTLAPPGVLAAGARWRVDTNEWQLSGAVFGPLSFGPHTVSFLELAGWLTPATQPLAVSNDTAVALSGVYTQLASLSVALEPPGAVGAGAQWRVDGGPWTNSGATVVDLRPGNHAVEYRPVTGWYAPGSAVVALAEGAARAVTGVYAAVQGRLTVALQPEAAATAGAQWRVDAGAWQASGAIANDLAFGPHTVSFEAPVGWLAPEAQTATVTNDDLIALSGVFAPLVPILGEVTNRSAWSNEAVFTGPGDGSGTGALYVAAWAAGQSVQDSNWTARARLDGPAALPLDPGGVYLYSLMGAYPVGSYTVAAWVDGNADGLLTVGEPRSALRAVDVSAAGASNVAVTVEDDSDGDGLPDWWEAHWFGALDETADGDPDDDGLSNAREYLIGLADPPGLNPADPDTDGDGIGDYDEDADLDQLSNGDELDLFGTDPVQSDSDDDGFEDGEEINARVLCGDRRLSSPLYSRAPLVQRSLVLDGAAQPIPDPAAAGAQRLDLAAWTLECWVQPASGAETGVLMGRATGGRTNFALRLDGNLPVVEFTTMAGVRYAAGANVGIPGNAWTHLAGVWNPAADSLALYVNGVAYQSQASLEVCARGAGSAHLGAGINGLLDEVRIWNTARTAAQIAAGLWQSLDAGMETNLAAYYAFDDGGLTVEDFAHSLQWDYALAGAARTSTDYVDLPGLPDLDRDGLPDWWERLFSQSPTDLPAAGDTDADGLNHLYEYFCDANPGADDTDNDGILDGAEDSDDDGLQNQDEQTHGSDPRLADTDDDGLSDLQEKLLGADPTDALNPLHWRALSCEAGTDSYLELSNDTRFGLTNWTLEAWVQPALGWNGGGAILERQVEPGVLNYLLALDGELKPTAGFGSEGVTAAFAIPADGTTWTHVAATYEQNGQHLTLYVNGVAAGRRTCSANPRFSGVGPIGQSVGRGFAGLIDDVRVWRTARPAAHIVQEMKKALSGAETNLVAYYRFDDGTSFTNGATGTSLVPAWDAGQVEDMVWHLAGDWLNRWRHAATLRGSATLIDLAGADNPTTVDADDDGMPDPWEIAQGLDPQDMADAAGDLDDDGVSNVWEYRLQTNPNEADTDFDGQNDGLEDSDGDTVANAAELTLLATRPDDPDTDDDGFSDGAEINGTVLCHDRLITSPRYSCSPEIPRSLVLDGGARAVPEGEDWNRFDQEAWTLECWVMVTGEAETGSLLERVTGNGQTNFALRLEENRPVVQFSTEGGNVYRAGGTTPVPANEWVHLAGTWDPVNHTLQLYVNGVAYQAQISYEPCARGSVGTTTLGRDIHGYMEALRIWRTPQTPEDIFRTYDQFAAFFYREELIGALTFDGVEFYDGSNSFADVVLDYKPGSDYPTSNLHANAEEVIGPPDGKFLSLGIADLGPVPFTSDQWAFNTGFVQVVFSDVLLRGSGDGRPDLYIFETGDTRQPVHVFISQNGDSWEYVGMTEGGTDGMDIDVTPRPRVTVNTPDLLPRYFFRIPASVAVAANTNTYRYVWLVDSGRVDPLASIGMPGADIDAVGVKTYGVWDDLMAWYPFRDGQNETVTNLLTGAVAQHGAEDYVHLRDWAYAIRDVTFTTAASAPIGGAWDEDVDLIADWWEDLFYNGNADALEDSDGDGLNNLYEHLADTNPGDADTDNDGVPDGAEDADDDGVVNADEEVDGSDPRLPDTDDDGVADSAELPHWWDPADAASPAVWRALACSGRTNCYAELPPQRRLGLREWTLEAWVKPASTWTHRGAAIERHVEPGVPNYFLALTAARVPVAGFGQEELAGSRAIDGSGGVWTHLAASYQAAGRLLRLYVNGRLVGERVCAAPPRPSGFGPITQRLGQEFEGALDEVRIWDRARTADELELSRETALTGFETNLVAYFRFDDGTSWTGLATGTSGRAAWQHGQVQDFVAAAPRDWLNQWHNAASLRGDAQFLDLDAGPVMLPPLVLSTNSEIPMDVLGGYGNGTGKFNQPRGLAVDSDRILYVADSGNHRIQRLDLRAWRWLAPLGRYGTAAGQFKQPLGLAVDRLGNLYVADANNNRVQKRDGVTGLWSVWGGLTPATGAGRFNGPSDVTVDQYLNVYVADHYNSRIQKRSPDGRWTTAVAAGAGDGFVRRPHSVAATPLGDLFVSDYLPGSNPEHSRVQRFSAGFAAADTNTFRRVGSTAAAEGGLGRPRDLALRTSAQVFVADTDNDRILLSDMPPTWQTVIGVGTLSKPEGVACDARGDLYVADTGNHRVLRFQVGPARGYTPADPLPSVEDCVPDAPAQPVVQSGLAGHPPAFVLADAGQRWALQFQFEIWSLTGSRPRLFARSWTDAAGLQAAGWDPALRFLRGTGPGGLRPFVAGDYMMRLRAWNPVGFGPWSEEALFTVNAPEPLLPPTITWGPAVGAPTSAVDFAWEVGYAASQFQLEVLKGQRRVRREDRRVQDFGGDAFTNVAITGVYRDAPASPARELPEGGEYRCRVRAYCPVSRRWTAWAERGPFALEYGSPGALAPWLSQEDYGGWFDRSPRPRFAAGLADAKWYRFEIWRLETRGRRPVRQVWTRSPSIGGGELPREGSSWGFDLLPGDYQWSVLAWNSPARQAGPAWQMDPVAAAGPLGAPDVLGGGLASGSSNRQQSIHWAPVPNAYTYQVELERDGRPFRTSPWLDTARGDLDLAPGDGAGIAPEASWRNRVPRLSDGSYRFRVRAQNGMNPAGAQISAWSAWSAPFVIDTAVPVARDLQATVTDYTVALSFVAPPEGYAAAQFELVHLDSSRFRVLTDQSTLSLPPGRYRWRIRLWNAWRGWGAWTAWDLLDI